MFRNIFTATAVATASMLLFLSGTEPVEGVKSRKRRYVSFLHGAPMFGGLGEADKVFTDPKQEGHNHGDNAMCSKENGCTMGTSHLFHSVEGLHDTRHGSVAKKGEIEGYVATDHQIEQPVKQLGGIHLGSPDYVGDGPYAAGSPSQASDELTRNAL